MPHPVSARVNHDRDQAVSLDPELLRRFAGDAQRHVATPLIVAVQGHRDLGVPGGSAGRRTIKQHASEKHSEKKSHREGLDSRVRGANGEERDRDLYGRMVAPLHSAAQHAEVAWPFIVAKKAQRTRPTPPHAPWANERLHRHGRADRSSGVQGLG